jgi:hypothetical protein
MGCCVEKPTNNAILDKQWTDLPIRKIGIEQFRNDLIYNYQTPTGNREENLKFFKSYFINENYLLGPNQNYHLGFRSLFTELANNHYINLLIFAISLLTTQESDTKRTKQALLDLSTFLDLDVFKPYDQFNIEYYIDYRDYKELNKIFMAMVSYDCTDDELDTMDTSSRKLKKIYGSRMVSMLIEENYNRIKKDKNKVFISDFIEKDMVFLGNDSLVREILKQIQDDLMNKGALNRAYSYGDFITRRYSSTLNLARVSSHNIY